MSVIRTISANLRKIFNGLGRAERQLALGDFLGTLRDDLDLGALSGVIPYAELDFTANPTHQDTFEIGPDKYEFINTATGTVVANDANIAVLRDAGGAAASLTNAINAINGDAAAAHASVTKIDTVTPAIGIGTRKVKAVADGAKLVIMPAVTQGGVPVASGAAATAIALAATLTSTKEWNVATLGVLGIDKFGHRVVGIKFAVTADMIASGRAQFECEFTVRSVLVSVRTSAGKIKSPTNDTFLFSGAVVTVTLPGAGGDLAAGDLVTIIAIG